MTETTKTTETTTAPGTEPARKSAGRPRKGAAPMTPAERQKAYKARLKAKAQMLKDEAGALTTVTIEATVGGSAKAAAKLEAATREALMRLLGQCFDELEAGEPENRSWASTAAKGVMTEMARRYSLNREGD